MTADLAVLPHIHVLFEFVRQKDGEFELANYGVAVSKMLTRC
jgi:hypothetical protein